VSDACDVWSYGVVRIYVMFLISVILVITLVMVTVSDIEASLFVAAVFSGYLIQTLILVVAVI